MSETKAFSIGAILSITDGAMMCDLGEVYGIRADAYLGAGSRAGTQRRAGKDRLVQLGVTPGGPAGDLELDIPRNQADPPDAAGRAPFRRQRCTRLDSRHRFALHHTLRESRDYPGDHRDPPGAEKQSHGSNPPASPVATLADNFHRQSTNCSNRG